MGATTWPTYDKWKGLCTLTEHSIRKYKETTRSDPDARHQITHSQEFIGEPINNEEAAVLSFYGRFGHFLSSC